MCIIISNENGVKICDTLIEKAIKANPHGFAHYDINTDILTKTMNKDIIKTLLSKEEPFIAHCRWATQGKVSIDNVHLFEIGNWLLAMNGTIKGFLDSNENDTKQLISILPMIKKEKLIAFLNSFAARFILIHRTTKKIIKTGNWFKHKNVYYSKDEIFKKYTTISHNNLYGYDYANGDLRNHQNKNYNNIKQKNITNSNNTNKKNPKKKIPYYLALTGTFKKGFYNNKHLSSETFISKGYTVNKYKMCTNTRSYVIFAENTNQDNPLGKNLDVDIYLTNNLILKKLDDILIPTHATIRKLVKVIDNANIIKWTWLYFSGPAYDHNNYKSTFKGYDTYSLTHQL